jgi:hypothetical protein
MVLTIDNPAHTDRLLTKLRASLPIAATMTSELMSVLREQSGGGDVPTQCQVTGLHYAGDEGGIVCELEFGRETGGQGFFVSLTHLRFDGRSGLTREIVAYQKHRTKRLGRLERSK